MFKILSSKIHISAINTSPPIFIKCFEPSYNSSKISHAGRTMITKSEYVTKLLKYLAEVVNVDPFDDGTNPKWGEKGQDLYIFTK